MKIVRHVAPDMRQALRSIRAQLGEDAVILSSKRIPEGVEVTAAVDFDANALQDVMNNPAALTAAPLPPTSPPVRSAQPAMAQPALVMLGQPIPMTQAVPAPMGPAPSYSQLAGDPAHSHAAASHYFPAQAGTDTRPFAHILGGESAPAPSKKR